MEREHLVFPLHCMKTNCHSLLYLQALPYVAVRRQLRGWWSVLSPPPLSADANFDINRIQFYVSTYCTAMTLSPSSHFSTSRNQYTPFSRNLKRFWVWIDILWLRMALEFGLTSYLDNIPVFSTQIPLIILLLLTSFTSFDFWVCLSYAFLPGTGNSL